MNCVKKGFEKKMAKSKRKKTKKNAKETISSKKARKIKETTISQTKAAEHVSQLLALHKLQGVLLAQLYKEV